MKKAKTKDWNKIINSYPISKRLFIWREICKYPRYKQEFLREYTIFALARLFIREVPCEADGIEIAEIAGEPYLTNFKTYIANHKLGEKKESVTVDRYSQRHAAPKTYLKQGEEVKHKKTVVVEDDPDF